LYAIDHTFCSEGITVIGGDESSSIVATGDCSGVLRIWDFRMMKIPVLSVQTSSGIESIVFDASVRGHKFGVAITGHESRHEWGSDLQFHSLLNGELLRRINRKYHGFDSIQLVGNTLFCAGGSDSCFSIWEFGKEKTTQHVFDSTLAKRALTPRQRKGPKQYGSQAPKFLACCSQMIRVNHESIGTGAPKITVFRFYCSIHNVSAKVTKERSQQTMTYEYVEVKYFCSKDGTLLASALSKCTVCI